MSHRLLRHFVLSLTGLALLAMPSRADAQYAYAGPKNASVPQIKLKPITFTLNLNPLANPVYPDMITQDGFWTQTAHNWARQETLLALAYLRANKEQIMAGNDPIYNAVFGAYYDKTNPFYSTYTADKSHFNQVLSTYSTMHNFLEQPTTYSNGAPANTSFGTAFGYDHGLRHWGYSTSTSRQNFDTIYGTANSQWGLTGNPAITFYDPNRPITVAGLLRWDQDNNIQTSDATSDTTAMRFANRTFLPFYYEKMDIVGTPDSPNTQYLGNLFFYDPSSSDFSRTLGERRTDGDPLGNGNQFYNGDLEFVLDSTQIFIGGVNYTQLLAGSDLYNIEGFDPESYNRFNSGMPFFTFPFGPNGYATETAPYDPAVYNPFQLGFNRYDSRAFSAPQMRAYQMIMMSFAEFSTTVGDSRGGAFVGLSGLMRLLDPTGRASIFGESMEARNFANFVELLNSAGISDPRQFPPANKNARQFNPALPSS